MKIVFLFTCSEMFVVGKFRETLISSELEAILEIDFHDTFSCLSGSDKNIREIKITNVYLNELA